MKRTIWALCFVTLAVAGAALSPAEAAYPDKPIQLIMPYAAGGSTDLLARALAQFGPKFFPQPLVVVNKAGGGAIPGRVDVVKARPDGYTVLFGWGSGEDLVVPHQRKLPYDVFNDFEVGPRLSIHSVIMTVPASSPHKSLAEFVAWAKTKEYVTGSVSTKGASVDITLQMFAKAAGFTLTSIPGSGSADALNKILGGHVDCSGQLPSDVLPHIKANRLRVLAVALEQRDPALPEVPTFRELGYNVVTAGSVKGVAFPKGTPKEIVAYWDKKFKEVSEDQEFLKILKDLGQPANYLPSAEYLVWAKANYDTYGRLLKEFGLETK
jgi:tripartite-type tricarboxylate transporter receptor subunit TctC